MHLNKIFVNHNREDYALTSSADSIALIGGLFNTYMMAYRG